MKIITQLTEREGWHLRQGFPVQVGVKRGDSPFSAGHRHRTMTEYFLLLRGELRLRVEALEFEVKPGDLVVVEPGEGHAVTYASPDALLLLLMPPPVPGDKLELDETERQK